MQAIADEVWPPTFGEILSPEQISYMMEMSFEIIGEEDIDIGNGFFMNDYVMNKKL